MQSNKRAKTKITVAWKTGLIPKVSSALVSKATQPALRGTSWGLITTGFKAYLTGVSRPTSLVRGGQQQAWCDGVWEGPTGCSYAKPEQHSQVKGGSLGPHWPEQNSGTSRLTWAHVFRTTRMSRYVRTIRKRKNGQNGSSETAQNQQPQWEMVAVSTKPLSEHEVQSCFGKTYCTQE